MAKNSVSTIVDIAQALGVSPSTVSRALKDHPYISQATKDKVKKMAVKLGYRRNTLAAGLRNRHSNTIGLIVPRISMYFQSAVITAIQNTVHSMGFNLIICQSNDSYPLEVELVNALYGTRVEGLITSCTVHTTDFSHFNIFTDNGIPLVFYDRVPRDYPAQIVRGEDFQGGYKVGKYLLSKGCTDIACINGLISCNLYHDRLQGLKAALKEAGVPLKKSRVFSSELSAANTRKIFGKLFSREPWPDALFCANDSTAITMLQEARALGVAVPEKLRIVGYSNDPRSCIISPAITSVEQFPAEVGTRAARAIVELIQKKGHGRKPAEIVIPVELIERESS
jgi:LacI family transcriptional regulator